MGTAGRPVGAMKSNERLLTLEEAAEFLRFHPRTVVAYVRRGELEGHLLGGRWRFQLKALKAFYDPIPLWGPFYRAPDHENSDDLATNDGE